MNYRILLTLSFFAFWLFIGFYLSISESPTFDEPVHLKAAQNYELGIYDFDPIEPPLVRRLVYKLGSLLPSSTNFLNYRLVIVILTGFLASYLVFSFSRKKLLTGIFLALLLLGEANLLAHSHYFTTDAISSFLAIVTFTHLAFNKNPSIYLLGILIGLTAASKVATVSFLLPLLVVYRQKFNFHSFFIIFMISSILIWSTYNFRLDPPLSKLDLNIPWGGYLRAIKENIQFASRGQAVYFWNQIYENSPWWKSSLILLTKISLPLLILFFIALYNRLVTKSELFLFSLVLLFHSFKSLNFGIRHMLIFPLFFIITTSKIHSKNFKVNLLIIFLISWHLMGTFSFFPQPITFANNLITNPQLKFSDSDYDWGQGLIQLKKTTENLNWQEIQLAYFGNVDPSSYLGDYLRVKDENPVATKKISELDYEKPLVISTTCYHVCGYSNDPILKEKSYTLLAGSFMYFHD